MAPWEWRFLALAHPFHPAHLSHPFRPLRLLHRRQEVLAGLEALVGNCSIEGPPLVPQLGHSPMGPAVPEEPNHIDVFHGNGLVGVDLGWTFPSTCP